MNNYPLYKNYYKFNLERIYQLSKNVKNKIIVYKPDTIKQRIDKLLINIYNPYSKDEKVSFILLEDNPEDNMELNYLTDYFTLEERIKANFINYESPLKYFNKNIQNINDFLKLKGINGIKSIKTTNDYLTFDKYMFDHTKFTNNFRISIILKILELFKPEKWLDISAGWGDRLIAAILSPYVKCYNSTDPNLALHKHYKKIIEKFHVSKSNYNIKKIGFENLQLRENYYDLVFSSPPFFDMEKYSEDKNDSLIKYSTDKLWYKKFLLKSLKKSFKALNKNRFLILNISFYKKNVNLSRERLIEDLKKIKNTEYCGCMYYYNRENWKPREFIIFKKL